MPKSTKRFTVKEAKETLAQYPDDAEARGFQNVTIVQKPVSMKQAETPPAAQ